MSTVLLLSTADTDLLAARASGADYRIGNPDADVETELPALLDGADLAVVRLLGGKRAWEDGLAKLKASGCADRAAGRRGRAGRGADGGVVRPGPVVAEALKYLVEGGPANLTEFARFLSDTVLLTGEGFVEPQKMPSTASTARWPRRAAVRPSACSSTGPMSSAATPRSWTPCATRSRRGAPTRCRCTAVAARRGPGALRDPRQGRRPGRHRPRRRAARTPQASAGGDEEAWTSAGWSS